MGDRFYTQQLAYLPKEASSSKTGLADTLGISGLNKLLSADLQRLSITGFSSAEVTMPSGRLKAPYIEQCNKLNDTVDWSKLTVAVLKEVINANILR